MNNTITFNNAVNNALAAAGLKSHDIIANNNLLRDGYFEIYLLTEWLEYDIYVDAENGEVVGFDSRPVCFGDSCERIAVGE